MLILTEFYKIEGCKSIVQPCKLCELWQYPLVYLNLQFYSISNELSVISQADNKMRVKLFNKNH